jgi:hypothetical protein
MRAIYYTNKQLRPLLDPRPLSRVDGILRPLLPELVKIIKCKNYKKRTSLQIICFIVDLLELNDGTIACFTINGIYLMAYTNHNNSLEIIKSFPIKLSLSAGGKAIHCKEDLILDDLGFECIRVFDRNFKQIQTIQQNFNSLLKVSENSFICQNYNSIMLYSKKRDFEEYRIKYEFSFKTYGPIGFTMEYLPKQKLLLHGFKKVIHVYSEVNRDNNQILSGHNDEISSITRIGDEKFASCSKYGEIKFWCIDDINSIKCTETITGQVKGNLTLQFLDQDFMITKCKSEMKIWSSSNNACIRTFNENSGIRRLIITKNKMIVTATTDHKVNVWKVSN